MTTVKKVVNENGTVVIKKHGGAKEKWNRKDKVEALLLLERNNFNLTKTAQDLNIAKQTLAYWKSELGDSVWGTKKEQAERKERQQIEKVRDKIEGETTDLAILKSARKLQLNEGDLLNSVYVAKFTLMDKIVELTKQSTSIKDIAYALDIIQKAESGFLDKDLQTEFSRRKSSFMDMVRSQYPNVDLENIPAMDEADYEIINDTKD